ncbi:hypothetical protein BDV10DRAFT_155459 [Aspergillus recurvatus]
MYVDIVPLGVTLSNPRTILLSMSGIALVTFAPDLTFAAASTFIRSLVPRSFQGSAGSLLVTIQNLSAAIVTAIGDTIGKEVSKRGGYSLGLGALHATWWFSLAIAFLAAVICVVFSRIPRSEKNHLEWVLHIRILQFVPL